MKAMIMKNEYRCGYDDHYILTNPSIEAPFEGAVCEEYETIETKYPQLIITHKQEARLDENGKPYIANWKEYSFDYSFEQWTKEGYDHSQKEWNDERNEPRKEYTRKVKKTMWVVYITSIEQLENLFNKVGIELDEIWGKSENGCDFQIVI